MFVKSLIGFDTVIKGPVDSTILQNEPKQGEDSCDYKYISHMFTRMSSSSITDPGSILGAVRGQSVSRLLARPVKRIAFWLAIVLPFIHLPLVATGLDSRSLTLAFLALVALNVVAIFLGHTHRQD